MVDKILKEEDPLKAVESIARNALDLMGKNVLSKPELQRLGEGVKLIADRAESLLEDLTEKTQTASEVFLDRLFHTKVQLSLKSHSEKRSDKSENSDAFSSTESENESKKDEDKKKAASVQALALPRIAPQETEASQSNHELKLCLSDYFSRLKTTKEDEIYPIMEEEGRTRLALIICNEEFDHLCNRNGAKVDLEGMQDLLENLGYSVVVKKNLTASEMEAELWQFAARQEHRSSDSTILVFMSHGVLEGVCGTKHSDIEPDILQDDIIFQVFNNRNCQSLRDKPKIIIMQACRGRNDGSVWVTDMGGTCVYKDDDTSQCRIRSDAVIKTHVEKDFIAFKSSTPHNSSWRTVTNGSLFISQIICHFKEYSRSHHLEAIFRKVQHSFETPTILAQMPTIERVSLTRYFYFFPGN